MSDSPQPAVEGDAVASPPPRTSRLAVASGVCGGTAMFSLMCGIVSVARDNLGPLTLAFLVFPYVLALPAFGLGVAALAQIDHHPELAGRRGAVLGVLSAVVLLVVVLLCAWWYFTQFEIEF